MNVKMKKFLKYFLKDMDLYNIVNDEKNLSLLWECCQIPDFVKKNLWKSCRSN